MTRRHRRGGARNSIDDPHHPDRVARVQRPRRAVADTRARGLDGSARGLDGASGRRRQDVGVTVARAGFEPSAVITLSREFEREPAEPLARNPFWNQLKGYRLVIGPNDFGAPQDLAAFNAEVARRGDAWDRVSEAS